MEKLFSLLACLFITTGFFSIAAAQQKPAPAYKLNEIRVVPFERQTGEFEAAIPATGDAGSFFNDISKNYLVMVEVSGPADSFEPTRKIEIVVMEGKKVRAKMLETIDLFNSDGKVYMPLWINSPLCSEVNITARIIGQKTPSTLKRKLTVFQCGE